MGAPTSVIGRAYAVQVFVILILLSLVSVGSSSGDPESVSGEPASTVAAATPTEAPPVAPVGEGSGEALELSGATGEEHSLGAGGSPPNAVVGADELGHGDGEGDAGVAPGDRRGDGPGGAAKGVTDETDEGAPGLDDEIEVEEAPTSTRAQHAGLSAAATGRVEAAGPVARDAASGSSAVTTGLGGDDGGWAADPALAALLGEEVCSVPRCASAEQLRAAQRRETPCYFGNGAPMEALAVQRASLSKERLLERGDRIPVPICSPTGAPYEGCSIVALGDVIRDLNASAAAIRPPTDGGDACPGVRWTQADETQYLFNTKATLVADYPELFAELAAATPPLLLAAHATQSCSLRHFSVGHSGSGLPFHTHDAIAGNEVVYGRKKWFISRDAPGGPGIGFNAQRTSLEWALTSLPEVSDALRAARGGQSPPEDVLYECTLTAGQVMFVPAGWYHSTINVGETVAVVHECTDSESDLAHAAHALSESVETAVRKGRRGAAIKQLVRGFTKDVIVRAREELTRRSLHEANTALLAAAADEYPHEHEFAFLRAQDALSSSSAPEAGALLALEHVRAALRINPQHAEGWDFAAYVHRELGDLNRSIEAARRALELDRNRVELHAQLASMLAQLGRSEEALAEYGRCIEACGRMISRGLNDESVGMAAAALNIAVQGMARNKVGPQAGSLHEVRGAVQQQYARALSEHRVRGRAAGGIVDDGVEL